MPFLLSWQYSHLSEIAKTRTSCKKTFRGRSEKVGPGHKEPKKTLMVCIRLLLSCEWVQNFWLYSNSPEMQKQVPKRERTSIEFRRKCRPSHKEPKKASPLLIDIPTPLRWQKGTSKQEKTFQGKKRERQEHAQRAEKGIIASISFLPRVYLSDFSHQ